MYAALLIQHMDDLITLKQNLALWLQDNDHKLYPHDLQLEKLVDA